MWSLEVLIHRRSLREAALPGSYERAKGIYQRNGERCIRWIPSDSSFALRPSGLFGIFRIAGGASGILADQFNMERPDG